MLLQGKARQGKGKQDTLGRVRRIPVTRWWLPAAGQSGGSGSALLSAPLGSHPRWMSALLARGLALSRTPSLCCMASRRHTPTQAPSGCVGKAAAHLGGEQGVRLQPLTSHRIL